MDGEQNITIAIDGTEYLMSTKIFWRDLEKIEKAVQNKCIDYKMIFAELVHDKIIADNKPPIDLIYDSCDMQVCAERFAETDMQIKESYDLHIKEKNLDVYEAFLLSVCEKFGGESYRIIERMGERGVDKIAESLSALAASFQSVTNVLIPSVFEEKNNIMIQLSEAFNSFSEHIAELLHGIRIPTISEERKEELRLSYREWGKYGWTMIPDIPVFESQDCPTDIKEANKIVLRYCTDKKMEYIFKLLREIKGIKKTDLEEAIFDFENKKYKSCVLLLFSLIDAKLIRLQREEDRNPRNNGRSVGLSAARKLFSHIKNEQEIERKFFMLLNYENVFECLKTVFAGTDDFKNQIVVINRNMVAHGMMSKKVIRKDCIQLFLLYYNLLLFLNVLY